MTIRKVYFKKVFFKQVLGCRIYIPNHKTWAQLFCGDPENDIKEIVDIDGVPTEVVKEYAYKMDQKLWDEAWEREVEIVEGKEVAVPVERYLEENFDIIWGV